MTRQLLPLGALALMALPALAEAQEPTRAGAAHAERQAKAATAAPLTPGRVERLLTRLEGGAMNGLFGSADGLGLRIGGIEQGSGLAIGPSWRSSHLSNGNVRVYASAARSIGGDTGVDAGVAIPQFGTHRLAVHVAASAARLPQERFFGTGRDTERANQTAFSLTRNRVTARGTIAASEWLHVTASAGVLETGAAEGRARVLPSLESRFSDDDAPGFGESLRFTTTSIATTVDYRDVPANPRSGGRYHVSLSHYGDRAHDRYSFVRVDAELEQHLSAWARQRVLTLRAHAVATAARSGHVVPFHLQPTLGGSRVLRGFVTDRFRDGNALALQAEYGWDLLPFLSAVAFVEGGTVAARWRELALRNLRTDYGLGFRFGSARTVAFRTDVAFGSGEGTRLTMRFNHAF